MRFFFLIAIFNKFVWTEKYVSSICQDCSQHWPHLMHDVEELQEDGSEARGLVGGRLVAAVCEAVSERQPLLLHQRAEPRDGPVVRVHQQLGHRYHLNINQDVSYLSQISCETAKRFGFILVCVAKSQQKCTLNSQDRCRPPHLLAKNIERKSQDNAMITLRQM